MIEVTLPDGRVLEVEAGDEAGAAKAAKAFLDQETAQQRLSAEDAQRGPVGRLIKNISDGTTQLAGGIPFVGGLVDEGNAFVRSGGGLWGDYDQELAYERERERQAAERSPMAAKVNTLAGGIGGGGAMLKALPAGTGALLPKTTTARIAAGVGTGAAGGAVEGFTRGEGGFENRVAEMPWSAAFGGILGGGFPLIAKGAGLGYNAIASWAANRGLDAKSINILLERLKSQGITPQQAEARLAELGDDAMLADVSPGMQAFTGGTALADIGAGNTIGQRLAARRAGGSDRVSGALDDAFGPAADPYTVQQQQRGIRSQAGYDPVFQNAPELPKSLQDITAAQLTSPAENLSLNSRAFMKGIFDEVDDALGAGNPEVTGRRLHDIRKRLDAQIVYDPRARDALSSADKANQDVLRDARASVDEILKDRFPGFAEADQVSSTSFRNQRAFDEGRTQVLRPGPNTMTPAELDARIAQSSDPENAFRRQGVRTELDRIMGNSRGNPGARVDRVMNRDWNDRKITSMIGQPKTERLGRALDADATFTESSNLGEPARQSRTAIVNAARDFWEGKSGPGVAGDMLTAGGTTAAVTGSPVAGGAAALGVGANRLARFFGNGLAKKSPALIKKTAENLTEQGDPLRTIVRLLADKAAELPKRSQAARNVELVARAILTAQAGRAGYESQRLYFGGPR